MKRFPKGSKTKIHLATEKYLEAFPDSSFDFIVSLHVIHHIQPQSVALKAIEEMCRIARKGVLILDLEKMSFGATIYRWFDLIVGVSKTLAEDGEKSQRRAYKFSEMQPAMEKIAKKYGFHLKAKKHIIMPYWVFILTKV